MIPLHPVFARIGRKESERECGSTQEESPAGSSFRYLEGGRRCRPPQPLQLPQARVSTPGFNGSRLRRCTILAGRRWHSHRRSRGPLLRRKVSNVISPSMLTGVYHAHAGIRGFRILRTAQRPDVGPGRGLVPPRSLAGRCFLGHDPASLHVHGGGGDAFCLCETDGPGSYSERRISTMSLPGPFG